jgi:uncharacterized phage protein (TIGR02216 family)
MSFGDRAAQLAGLTAVLLGWRPEDFWRATPAELADILAALAPASPPPPTRALIDQLQERFPDGGRD